MEIKKTVNYYIDYTDISNKTLSEVRNCIQKQHKKTIGDISIRELSTMNGKPRGIYIFSDPSDITNILYVGKSTSRSFIERIPAHFDPRKEAWMNALPKKVQKSDNSTYDEALFKSLNFQVLFIGIDDFYFPKGTANHVESILRSFLQPRYNKKPDTYVGTERLENLVRSRF
ncbi:MAG: hypothetical protein PHG35_07095 [Dehalococcoidales bacterium]|nr:hypothetical protein [Dehalococcoidales bacterium]